ncbi:MAG: T9SS type A sorting domain-containing protein [Bacteroidetes bacterium]|nr:T9SS type A sorting domain-containing protein [Bacteroidota bacterium]
MKKTLQTITIVLALTLIAGLQWLISSDAKTERERRNMVDTRVDNNGYYKRLAQQGLYTLNPEIRTEPAIYTGSAIKAFSVITDDSPDVPLISGGTTQSENSIFVHPLNSDVVIASNNSTNQSASTLYGANDLYSFTAGETWQGKIQGVAGGNSGDPTTAIGRNGRWYINYISNPGGQGIAYSDNNGVSWTARTVSPNPGQLADKNHMWIDNSPSSLFGGNLYVAWSDFGGANNNQIVVSRSTNHGDTWSTRVSISNAVNAGSHNQGVNLQTGPNGEVYAVWSIYNSWPSDEGAIGFAKSLDGGATWQPATRIINNIRGIRNTQTKKNHRVNSFPVMAVDISDGPGRGNIYVVWANIGVPGINQNNGIDVYMIRSTNGGSSWSQPIRVNQNPQGQGKEHYFPWITCDPENGVLSVIFYGDRNVNQNQVEVFCANSFDGGDTWEDFKVSDVAFTPAPIPGLAGGYMGDYLGISARGGKVYPIWTDNRTGVTLSYTSPYMTNPLSRPFNLQASVDFPTGNASLQWNYTEAPDFIGFKIYRNNELVGTTTDTVYVDALPDYGVYTYQVTAAYTGDAESGAVRTTVQWGDARIATTPASISQVLLPGTQATQTLTISNVGQLPMNWQMSAQIINNSRETNAYCSASGGGDEYISRVQIGNIDNVTGSNNYADYTNLSTEVRPGEPITLTVTNGNPYSADQCGVWVDWNQNEVFDDAPITVSGTPGQGPYTAIINPPANALPGPTRMRIRITWTGAVNPCGTTTYGEVEDYTLNVVNWLSYTPSSGTIAAGNNTPVAITLKANDLTPGDYRANLRIANNDPDNPVFIVPVHLKVSTFLVSAEASAEEICHGDSVQLTAALQGNIENLSFIWKNSAGDIIGQTQNLTIIPDITDSYTLTAFRQNDSLTSNPVNVVVHALPEVALGENLSLCGHHTLEFDVFNEGASYLWSTGDTTAQLNLSTEAFGWGTHQIWVQVTSANGCVVIDSLEVTLKEPPVVALSGPLTACGSDALTFDAGNAGAQFLWSTGDTTQIIQVGSAQLGFGTHQIQVLVTSPNGCQASDSVQVSLFEAPPQISLGADTVMCAGAIKTLRANVQGYTFNWSTGASTSEITADTLGYGVGFRTYWVELISADGCVTRSQEITIEFRDCTGLNESALTALQVMPNPGDGRFNLVFPIGTTEKVNIAVLNSAGKMVYQQRGFQLDGRSNYPLDLSNLPPGNYTLVVDGRSRVSKKLIINR